MISIWIFLPMIMESSGTKTCMNSILKIIAIICSLHLDSYITPSSPAVSKKTFCCKPTNWLDPSVAGIHIYTSERLCLSLEFFAEGMPSSPKLPSASSVLAMQIFCSAAMGFGKSKGDPGPFLLENCSAAISSILYYPHYGNKNRVSIMGMRPTTACSRHQQ